jgi:hypothetical protein
MQFLERRTKGPPNPWFVPKAKPRKPVVSIRDILRSNLERVRPDVERRSEPLGFHRLKAVVSIRSETLRIHRLKAVVSSRMNVPTKHSRRGFQTVKRIYAAVLETAKKK